jgi:transcriptional repressor NrdR
VSVQPEPAQGPNLRKTRIGPSVEKDGSRVEFDREKLSGSMKIALRKRPVETEALDAAIVRIEDRLRALGEREVPTSRVGDLVMRELAKLDKIAYIRFASVYRRFETPEDFREALQEVKAKKRRK